MREVFKLQKVEFPAPLHDVFYTITEQDVGKSAAIVTTVGVIPVSQVLGRVLHLDVGKRLYAGLSDDRTRTVWSAENNEQRDKRLGIQRLEVKRPRINTRNKGKDVAPEAGRLSSGEGDEYWEDEGNGTPAE